MPHNMKSVIWLVVLVLAVTAQGQITPDASELTDADLALIPGYPNPCNCTVWSCPKWSGHFCHPGLKCPHKECKAEVAPDGYYCYLKNKCEVGPGRCKAGVCVGKYIKICELNPNKCKENLCDPKTGYCTIEKNKPDNTTCYDGKFCTVKDQCKAGECQGTRPRRCKKCFRCSERKKKCVPVKTGACVSPSPKPRSPSPSPSPVPKSPSPSPLPESPSPSPTPGSPSPSPGPPVSPSPSPGPPESPSPSPTPASPSPPPASPSPPPESPPPSPPPCPSSCQVPITLNNGNIVQQDGTCSKQFTLPVGSTRKCPDTYIESTVRCPGEDCGVCCVPADEVCGAKDVNGPCGADTGVKCVCFGKVPNSQGANCEANTLVLPGSYNPALIQGGGGCDESKCNALFKQISGSTGDTSGQVFGACCVYPCARNP